LKDEAYLKRIEEAVRCILNEFNIDTNRAHMAEMYKNTPRRVAQMYLEIFSGLDKSTEPKLTLFDNPGYQDILAIRQIPFYSLCCHHLLPIFGYVSIAYIPGEKILGLSKFPRIVKYFASRPQIQEDLTKELADYLCERLKARGVLVIIKARHMCMEMRGPRSPNVETVSSAIRGSFMEHPSTKDEALRLLQV
jgi:GTP cyclohydrolase I